MPRDELAASLAARRELGPDYDAAFVEAVADRLEAGRIARIRTEREQSKMSLVMPCLSLLVAIPVSIVAVVQSGVAGLFVVWLALTVINVAYAVRSRG